MLTPSLRCPSLEALNLGGKVVSAKRSPDSDIHRALPRSCFQFCYPRPHQGLKRHRRSNPEHRTAVFAARLTSASSGRRIIAYLGRGTKTDIAPARFTLGALGALPVFNTATTVRADVV